METRSWVTDGARAVGYGTLGILLAVLNFPLLVLWVVALALTPVAGVGMVALPFMTAAVRGRANLARRLAARAGVPIAEPYAPRPQKSLPGGWRRYKWILTDPATWRDLAWLIPGAVSGLVLGIVGLVLPLYGFQGITLLPLWLYLGVDWYGYGLFWPIESFQEGLLSLPQGVVILALGVAAAPWLRWTDAQFTRLFLAPTRAAGLRLRVAHLTESRADTVDAQAAELRRIERDLHDGAQARLVSLGMTIGLAEELLERDPAAARKLLSEARETSGDALTELRHLVRGIHPPVLAERGLDGAVRALAMSLPLQISVDIDLPGRPETPVESAAYFAVAEALTNVVRHSGAHTAAVTLRHADDRLLMVVLDDGRGGADAAGGTGLRGIERRLAAFDGTMTLSSPPGGPTVVTLELPCVLSSPRTSPSSGTV
ncbi:sensor histidine kinase [Symbioplanes lichenis]|uniref:sensor histidine kinase n=1 Tax=Symbioplanes lichenis TaxID=1629072 RepID=UPI0027392B82|nr:sensor domain-containing protein [Actinoplanes lichenis]